MTRLGRPLDAEAGGGEDGRAMTTSTSTGVAMGTGTVVVGGAVGAGLVWTVRPERPT